VNDTSIYRELQRHLDKLPVGFPPTDSGVEIKLLEYLFSPIEAKIAVKLKKSPETVWTIYRRVRKLGYSKKELSEYLKSMTEKGLIIGRKKGKRYYFRNAMFIIGIYEFQVNRITDEFMVLMHQYIDEAFAEEFNLSRINQVRTIPIEKSISQEKHVYSYDNLKHLINKAKPPIGVAQCICRIGNDLIGNSCKLTDLRETCFTFSQTAKYYIDLGYARSITKQEALEILKEVEDAGLIIQPGNSKKLGFICTCCGCCCEGIRLVNKYPKPAELYSSSYQALINQNECSGCKTCVKRCQIKAISIKDNIAFIDLDYCIGCGLCVTTCPKKAIQLVKKKKGKKPPRGHFRLVLRITRKKSGNWAAFKLILMTIFSLKLYYIIKKK